MLYNEPHRTQNREDTWEETNWLFEKPIHDITNFDYPSNSRKCTSKKALRTQYYLSTSPKPLTKGRWSKYYSPTAYPKKLWQP